MALMPHGMRDQEQYFAFDHAKRLPAVFAVLNAILMNQGTWIEKKPAWQSRS